MAFGEIPSASKSPPPSEDPSSLTARRLEVDGWPHWIVEKFISNQEIAKGPMIVVDNLTKSFDGNPVLKGFTLNVFEGEIFGIVGISGAGKTTLLETIAGLHDADKGSVSIKDPKTGRLASIRNDPLLHVFMGFSPQVPSVYPELTVRENLTSFGSMLDMPCSRIKERIEVLSFLLNIRGVLDKRVSTISRGIQKKADIACAILNEPRVLVLDEPVRDLDPISRKEVYAAVKAVHENGATIIVSSHAIEELAGVCTRMGVLHQGSLTKSLCPAEMTAGFYEIMLITEAAQYQPYKERLDQAAIPARIAKGALHVRTTEPELVIRFLLDSAQAVGQKIVDLQVTRPRVEDLFEGWVSP